jgi:hypothetical protein
MSLETTDQKVVVEGDAPERTSWDTAEGQVIPRIITAAHIGHCLLAESVGGLHVKQTCRKLNI